MFVVVGMYRKGGVKRICVGVLVICFIVGVVWIIFF